MWRFRHYSQSKRVYVVLGCRLSRSHRSPLRLQIHGRSREQRYTRLADWDYIGECAKQVPDVPMFGVLATPIFLITFFVHTLILSASEGNGDIMSYEEAEVYKMHAGVSGIMVARGALQKPWVFTEIKEGRCAYF